jgi:hypothetical protein
MATLYGALRLRPTRIGFLVAPTNLSDIRRVMQVCSCLWGGFYNPIIPVCTELPEKWTDPRFRHPTGEEVAKGYVNFFEPDVFVESEPGLAARAGVADALLSYGTPRVATLLEFFEPKERAKIPFGLNIFDLYKDIYDREFKFVRRHDQHVVLFESGTPYDAFVEAAFGAFPLQGFLSPMAHAYSEGFEPLRLAPSGENCTKVTKENYATPLLFTEHRIKRDHDIYGDPTLFVVDPNSPLDLIDLWNLRQFTPYVVPLNVDWVSAQRDFIRDFVTANYRALPGNPNGVMIHTTVQFGRSFSEKRATEIVAGLLDGVPHGSWSLKLWYEQIWAVDRVSDFMVRPRRGRISAAATELELSVSVEQKDRSVRFSNLSPEFASLYGGGAARWVNVLRLHSFYSNESLAIVLPPDLTIETLTRLRLGHAAIVAREGLVLPQHFKNHGEYLHLLTGTQAIVEWLKGIGIEAKASDAGRIADQVLNSIGGLMGVSLLAHKETLETLDNMAKNVRQYSDGKTEERPDRAKPVRVWQGLVEKRNNQSRWFKDFSLDGFVKAGILRLGLSVSCPNCMNQNWYGLPDVDEQLVCERCLKRFDFPQGSLNFGYAPWQYRVVGPFSVPNFARGAYATVLALRFFSENLGNHPQLTYCTGLEIALDHPPCEIDFAFWCRRDRLLDRDEDPVLVFGEAKSFALESFEAKDFRRMERFAAKFPGAFLVFATLKESLSEYEKSEIAKLALWGRERLRNGQPRSPVIVLTAMEMFSERHIKQTWEDFGGKHKELASPAYIELDNLWELANITQKLYLELPDRDAHLFQPAAPTSSGSR